MKKSLPVVVSRSRLLSGELIDWGFVEIIDEAEARKRGVLKGYKFKLLYSPATLRSSVTPKPQQDASSRPNHPQLHGPPYAGAGRQLRSSSFEIHKNDETFDNIRHAARGHSYQTLL